MLSFSYPLQEKGAQVSFSDPHNEQLSLNGESHQSCPLTQELVKQNDLVIVTTDHTGVDYDMVAQNAKCIVDTRNAYKDRSLKNIVRI